MDTVPIKVNIIYTVPKHYALTLRIIILNGNGVDIFTGGYVHRTVIIKI